MAFAHDAPQLSAPVSDRVLQDAMWHSDPYLDLDDAQALAAMGLPDDGSNRSESFLDARRGAMWDQMQSSSTPPSSSRPPPPLPPSSSGRVVASGTTTAPSQTAVDRHPNGARRRRRRPPHLVETFATAVNRHISGATRRLADDDRRYTLAEFATCYRRHADAMWKRARERQMAIWSRVVARLKENVRRIHWRIIVRKMNRFARACGRYADRLVVDKRIDGGPRLVPPKDWPAVRTPQPSP